MLLQIRYILSGQTFREELWAMLRCKSSAEVQRMKNSVRILAASSMRTSSIRATTSTGKGLTAIQSAGTAGEQLMLKARSMGFGTTKAKLC